jgi:hypothetical protein
MRIRSCPMGRFIVHYPVIPNFVRNDNIGFSVFLIEFEIYYLNLKQHSSSSVGTGLYSCKSHNSRKLFQIKRVNYRFSLFTNSFHHLVCGTLWCSITGSPI